MTHIISYPKGGSNKMWEPMHIEANLGINTKITIQGLTDGRDGALLRLLDEDGDVISHHFYNYHSDLGYHFTMARDMARDMNILFELMGLSNTVTAEDLQEIMSRARDKCESRYGNRLPDSEYEVLIKFAS